MHAHGMQRQEFAVGDFLQCLSCSQSRSDDAFLVRQPEERGEHACIHDRPRLRVAHQYQGERRRPGRAHGIRGRQRRGDEGNGPPIACQIHPRAGSALHTHRAGSVFDQVAQCRVVCVVSGVQHAAIKRQTIVFCGHRSRPCVSVFHAHAAFDHHYAKVERIQPGHAERGEFVQFLIALLHARRTLQVGQDALQALFAFGCAHFRDAVPCAQAHGDAQVRRVHQRHAARRCVFGLRGAQ